MSLELMRIGDLARLTDKSVRALHLYEERGLLRPAARSAGGFRLYDHENVLRINYITELQQLGHTLDEIRDLLVDWQGATSPTQAMLQIEQIYRHRLNEVQQQKKALEALEENLTSSLRFLEGCHGCSAEGEAPSACGQCQRAGQAEALTLIHGLTGR